MEKVAWFYPEFVDLNLQAPTAESAIAQLGARLEQAGFVRASFVAAVTAREQVFATGLPDLEVGVAIPHTDVAHVIRSAIAIGVSAAPIEFREMGDPEGRIVPVRVIFMLAVHDPSEVIGTLQKLIDLFQRPGLLNGLLEQDSAAALVDYLGAALA